MSKQNFAQSLDKHRQHYRSVMNVVADNLDVIESSIAQRVPLDIIVQDLNKHFHLDTNKDNLKTCLYRLRRKRKALTSPEKTKTKPSTTPKRSALPSSKPKPLPAKTTKTNEPDNQDDWNETEKFVEYRLEDCIRDFVYLKNGCVMTTFPKGTIFTAEIRAAFNRLQLTADQFSYKLKK